MTMQLLPWLPERFWHLLALCLLAFVALWWSQVGARRFGQRRGLRRRIAELGPVASTSELASLTDLRNEIADLRGEIVQARRVDPRASRRQPLRDPLYGVPWFLFVGDAAAGVPALLAAARNALAPEQGAGGAPGRGAFWRWCALPAMTAIETSPAAVCDSGSQRERRLWYQALMELAIHRERLPLNGIVVCVDAAGLLEGEAAVMPLAEQLRRLIDETIESLRVRLPVYLVVTGLDRLSGYSTVRAALPPAVLTQALGHRLPENEPASGSERRLDALYTPLAERVQALGMGLLREQAHTEGRQAILDFVGEVQSLQPALQVLVNRLFERRGPAQPVRWRGLYLVAAPSDPSRAAFVADLFQRFLPKDQPLARTT